MTRTLKVATVITAIAFLQGVNPRAERSVMVYASDVLGEPHAAVTLAAGLVEVPSGEIDGVPIKGERVEFTLQSIDGYALANPLRIGTVETDAWGRAAQLWTPEGTSREGLYEVEVRLNSESKLVAAPVRIRVVVLSADRPALLVKLDAQRTSPDDAQTHTKRPTDVSGSRILDELAEQYQFVYLTDIDMRASRAFKIWMRRRALPDGPVLLLAENADELSLEARTGARVRDLLSRHPQITFGIGATAADARVFAASGLAAIVVPNDLDTVTDVPSDALVTSSWRTVFTHIKLCEKSGELLRTLGGGSEGASAAERQLERLGRAGAVCIDRLSGDADLRWAAIYMSGRLRAIDAFRGAIDWTTPLALRDSLLAAWRFGEPSVIRQLYAEPRASEADPIPEYLRWETVGSSRAQGPDSVVHTIRLIGENGQTSIREITCVRQPDATWRVLAVDPA